jgi:dTMP kinase
VIVTFEGGEGTGKTTSAENLCIYLRSKGLPVISFREPGGSSFSEAIRGLFLKQNLDCMTELLLMLSSRRQNIVEIIEPGLAAGKIIVIDRFIDSTLVYQGIVGGLGYRVVERIMNMTNTWLEPDLTFIMDVNPEDALSRIEPNDRFEHRGIDYHKQIRNAFLEISNGPRHRIIDTSREKDDVHRQIIQEIEACIA